MLHHRNISRAVLAWLYYLTKKAHTLETWAVFKFILHACTKYTNEYLYSRRMYIAFVVEKSFSRFLNFKFYSADNFLLQHYFSLLGLVNRLRLYWILWEAIYFSLMYTIFNFVLFPILVYWNYKWRLRG